MADAYIVGAVRTATGKKKGRLSAIHPIDLGAAVIDELVDRTGIPVDAVDDVMLHSLPVLERGLGRRRIEAAVHLQRVAVDDLAVESQGQLEGQLGFTRAGRPQNGEEG